MAHSDHPAPDVRLPQAVPGIGSVKDDMVAIFGSDRRADVPAPPARPHAPDARRHRAPMLAALSVCGVVAMLVAGVIGGQSVVDGGPATGARPPTQAGVRNAAIPSAAPSLGSSPSPAIALASLPQSDSPVDAPADADRPLAPVAAAPSPPRAEVAVAPARAEPRDNWDDWHDRDTGALPVAVAPRPQRAAMPDDARVRQAFAASVQPACATAADCLALRLRTEERGVARAYDTATNAGVRARTLREYRAEWVRAQGLALRRPQEAIRVYAMIGSDLRLLAADPTLD